MHAPAHLTPPKIAMAANEAEIDDAEGVLKKGLLENEWAILGGQMGGSMQERTLRRRYSSSFRPYARR